MLASLLSNGNNAKQDRVVKSVTIHPLLHPAPLKECCVLRPHKSTMSSPLSPRSSTVWLTPATGPMCNQKLPQHGRKQPTHTNTIRPITHTYQPADAHVPASRCTIPSQQRQHHCSMLRRCACHTVTHAGLCECLHRSLQAHTAHRPAHTHNVGSINQVWCTQHCTNPHVLAHVLAMPTNTHPVDSSLCKLML
jgi:hypothetical protein